MGFQMAFMAFMLLMITALLLVGDSFANVLSIILIYVHKKDQFRAGGDPNFYRRFLQRKLHRRCIIEKRSVSSEQINRA